MKLLLIHGWGFDARVWDRLAPLLPAGDVLFADRGYFGEPCQPSLSERHVVVAHSLGAMQALRAPANQCSGLVAINGFDCFAAQDGNPGVAVRVLDRMLSHLERDCVRVVTDFRARCGAPSSRSVAHREVLRRDLEFLRNGDCRSETRSAQYPILALQGEADPILPPDLRQSAFLSAERLQRVSMGEGGHLLPVTHASWCADAIARFVGNVA